MKFLAIFILMIFLSFGSANALREYLNGGATPGCTEGEWVADGPASSYTIDADRGGGTVRCKNQDANCWKVGFDCEAESWFVDFNFVVLPPEPTDQVWEIYLDPVSNFYEGRPIIE